MSVISMRNVSFLGMVFLWYLKALNQQKQNDFRTLSITMINICLLLATVKFHCSLSINQGSVAQGAFSRTVIMVLVYGYFELPLTQIMLFLATI